MDADARPAPRLSTLESGRRAYHLELGLDHGLAAHFARYPRAVDVASPAPSGTAANAIDLDGDGGSIDGEPAAIDTLGDGAAVVSGTGARTAAPAFRKRAVEHVVGDDEAEQLAGRGI